MDLGRNWWEFCMFTANKNVNNARLINVEIDPDRLICKSFVNVSPMIDIQNGPF